MATAATGDPFYCLAHDLWAAACENLHQSGGRFHPVLDRRLLAEAINDFERNADLSVIVETNVGSHRSDCIHVDWIADAYQRLAAAVPEDA